MRVENHPQYIIRAVLDTLKECNLRCKYCHPGETWEKKYLPANLIEQTLGETENKGLLEVTRINSNIR
jgi:molybdenum cofactor biosynthesis enzyme MoaA